MLVSGLHLPRIVRPDGSEMVGGVLKMGIAWYSPLIVVMLMWKYESYTSNYIYITIGSNIIIHIYTLYNILPPLDLGFIHGQYIRSTSELFLART